MNGKDDRAADRDGVFTASDKPNQQLSRLTDYDNDGFFDVVVANWGQSVRQTSEISGTPSAGDLRAHFGLGDATNVTT